MASNLNIPKGDEADRAIWKAWAIQNGLANNSGDFSNEKIGQRRASFRSGIELQDLSLLNSMERVLIDIFHGNNNMIERWPETVRVMLNRTITGANPPPFDSWYGPPGLEQRKQATRVWTELISFLILEYHLHNITMVDDNTLLIKGSHGNMPSIGLQMSNKLRDDIMDIVESQMLSLDIMESAVHQLCLSLVMQACTNPHNNPLLFWVGLVLQTEEFGNQRRFEFNGMQDTLTTREKLEAIVHYARVLVMDHAFMTWLKSKSVPQDHKIALQQAVNHSPCGWGWIDRGEPRPAMLQGDPEDIGEPYWQDFLKHFNQLSKTWLMKGSKSPVGVILGLLDA